MTADLPTDELPEPPPPPAPPPRPRASGLLTIDPATRHALSRWTFGATDESLEAVQAAGRSGYLEAQLAQRDDRSTAAQLSGFRTLGLSAAELAALYAARSDIPRRELRAATFVRALYSEAQLYERMVLFWSEHFSIYMADRLSSFLKPVDDREVVRAHALGRFEDLLVASAHSPAMLYYLNQDSNRRGRPNENYARELLELHTLGVEGGYDEDDVRELARLLTGWSYSRDTLQFEYRDAWHDPEPATVLGKTYGDGASGYEDGLELVVDLARHPATLERLATKLARHFVADEPPRSAVETTRDALLASGGDIPTALRALFGTEAFWASANGKLRRPFDAAVGLLRAAGAELDLRAEGEVPGRLQDTRDRRLPLALATLDESAREAAADAMGHVDEAMATADPTMSAVGSEFEGILAELDGPVGETDESIENGAAGPLREELTSDRLTATARSIGSLLAALAHSPFLWPTPDGYPEEAEDWLHSGATLARWNAALNLLRNRFDGIEVEAATLRGWPAPESAGELVERLSARLLQRSPTAHERRAALEFLALGDDDPLEAGTLDERSRHLAALLASGEGFHTR